MIVFLNEYGARWAGYFVPAIVQNTIFLAIVLLVLHRLRHASAGVRYLVGLVGLAKLLLPPLLPSSFGLGAEAVIGQSESISRALRFIPAGNAAGGASTALPEARLGLLGGLLALWAMVAAIYMIVAVAQTLRLAWGLRNAERITDIEGLRLPAGIGIYLSDRVAVPMTLVLFPRRIFVPAAWTGWSGECRRMVLRHESAHLRRMDGMIQILQIVAQAMYFFHPLVMILSRRLDADREMACDDLSAGRGEHAGVEYSRFLVEIAESIVRAPTTCESASTLLKRKNELLNRVRYQMKGGAMVSRGRMILLLAALLMLVLTLSWYHTGAAPGEEIRTGTEDSRRGERGPADQEKLSPPARPAEPAPGAVPAEPAPPREPACGSVSVEIGEGEKVVLEGKEVAWKIVAEQLGKIAAEDNKKVVMLTCADDTPMEQIHRIHEVLRVAGLDRIEYRNGTGYGKPLVLPPPDMEERLAQINEIARARLFIGASGELTLDGEAVEMKDLGGIVAKRIEKVPPLVILLQTEKKTLYKDFLGALAELERAGAQRIAIQEPTGR